MSALAAPARTVNRPRAYDACPDCGSLKTRTARRCWDCRVQAEAAASLPPDAKVMRQFIHRANYAVRVRLGRTDTMSPDAALPLGPCYHCGATDPGGWDHLVPLSKGGANTVENLVPCCLRCNHRKGARGLAILDDPEWMTLTCSWCGTDFRRRSTDVRSGHRRGDASVFCSVACRGRGYRRPGRNADCRCPR